MPVKQLLLVETETESDTEEIAHDLASILIPGDVVALYGPLGAGKTAFVRGLARGLGCRQAVKSPTFNLINEYPGDLPLYHIDFYRLENQAEITDLGWTDFLNADGVVAIEWADKIKDSLPRNRFDVLISFGGPEIRIVEVIAVGNHGDR
jgi:tRNA threonylcarbamoyladenosine biosynthesis protein TsaE